MDNTLLVTCTSSTMLNSLLETVADVSAYLTNRKLRTFDPRFLTLLIIEWSKEFDTEHQFRMWNGEYQDSLSLFLDKKIDIALKTGDITIQTES